MSETAYTTAIIKAGEGSLARITDSSVARQYLEKVSIPPEDFKTYSGQLALSRKTDKADCRKRHGVLAVFFGKAKPKPSLRTELLESIVKSHEEIVRSVQEFAGVPETVEGLRAKYAELSQKEQALVARISGYRQDISSVEQKGSVLGRLLQYDKLDAKAQEEVRSALSEGADIDFDDADTRQMLFSGISDENEKKIGKIQIDYPFAERELLSARRQMKAIEQYDQDKVKAKFLPAMDVLHEMKCEYEEAKTHADIIGSSEVPEGIISRGKARIEELRQLREEAQIHLDVESEQRAAEDSLDAEIFAADSKSKMDLKARMDMVLGKVAESPKPYVEEPVIIEAEFTEKLER
ncbi:MAG: hypothetical protein PHO02_06310 [Candidatus Nanoarchaeia archaeon]|nr:hypothetical protein [Candidatus Nanoarchaeia archaeon]